MARITIIPIDGAIYVDGLMFGDLDFTSCDIPSDVHALQWFNTNGWIEFTEPTDLGALKAHNQSITELPTWVAACLQKWDEAKVAADALQAQRLAEKAARIAAGGSV